MDEDLFLLALKSTIDKVMLDLRTALLPTYPALLAVEVDDLAQTDAIQKSEAPTLIWSFGSLHPTPRPPMYQVEFMVGVKTTADAGNYLMTALLTKVRQQFQQGESLQLYDYTGAVAGVAHAGSLFIGANEVSQQEFDRQSGMRYAVVRGSAVAYG